MNDEAELSWHPRKGWLLRTPLSVPYSALLKLCEYAIASQVERYNAMPPTHPKKRLLEYAIGELQKVKITQIVVPEKKTNLQNAPK